MTFRMGQQVRHGTHGRGVVVDVVFTSDEPRPVAWSTVVWPTGTGPEVFPVQMTTPKRAPIYRVSFHCGERLCDPRRLSLVNIY